MKPETPEVVPEVTFKTRIKAASVETSTASTVCEDTPFSWIDLTTTEIFKGKKVVLFALPGAFTPTCSAAHLPGYEKNYDEFKALGIDEVVCLSVNDAFVMTKWATTLLAEKVMMLPDGNAEFTRKMGMLVKKENVGFGERSWRYSMLVDDGKVVKMFIEPGMQDNSEVDPFEVSDAETMLEFIRNN